MTNEEAKFILQAYRPNGSDAGDPAFEAALEQAKRDPSLASWLQRSQEFDRTMAAKMKEAAVPAGLRAAILAGSELSRQDARRSWWYRPQWLAAAAAILIMFTVGVAVFVVPPVDATAPLPVFAANYVAGGFFLKRHNANVDELRSWLATQKAPLPTELPAGFTKLRSLGCKTLSYQGKDVSLICFGEGKEYHLFVARRDDFPVMPASAVPSFLVHKGYATAAWSDAQNHYVVVTDDTLPALKECLHCSGS